MRSWIIALCIAAQLGVLAFMVYGRESVISKGYPIQIVTAPIDPRDPFRGDFVRLSYPLNQISHAPVRWQPADYSPAHGDKVYAIMKQVTDQLYDVDYYTNIAPDTDEIFMRGRLVKPHSVRGATSGRIKFGIEQLFVQQDDGTAIENRQGVRGGMQNAMHVNVALGGSGTAVLTGYEWSSLAIGLELTEAFQLTTDAELTDSESVSVENPNLDTDTDLSLIHISEPTRPY